jgi:hypothetical protein
MDAAAGIIEQPMILPNPPRLLDAGCQIEEKNKNKLDPFFSDSGKDESY